MIRLNDINKTVIDESKVVAYDRFADNYYDSKTGISKNMEVISLFVGRHYIKAWYESKELRDKDLELLDKLFDVKSIEDRVEERGEENKLEHSCKPEEDEHIPFEEKYITWEEVKNSKKNINIKLSNGDIHNVGYDEGNERIQFFVGFDYEGCIYEEDLFNALMLKKVE